MKLVYCIWKKKKKRWKFKRTNKKYKESIISRNSKINIQLFQKYKLKLPIIGNNKQCYYTSYILQGRKY